MSKVCLEKNCAKALDAILFCSKSKLSSLARLNQRNSVEVLFEV